MFKGPATSAEQKMVVDNYRLVIKLAKFYSKAFLVPVEDLSQEGVFGLISAAQKYDSTKAKFSTYAYRWIKQVMLNYCHKQQAQGLTPGIKSRAEADIRPRVMYVTEGRNEDHEYEAVYIDGKDSDLLGRIGNSELVEKINRYVNTLPKKQRRVIQLLLQGMSGPEVEAITGISRQLAQQYYSKFAVEVAEVLNIEWINHKYAKCQKCKHIKRFDRSENNFCMKCRQN